MKNFFLPSQNIWTLMIPKAIDFRAVVVLVLFFQFYSDSLWLCCDKVCDKKVFSNLTWKSLFRPVKTYGLKINISLSKRNAAIQKVSESYMYIPNTINIELIFWHTQWIDDYSKIWFKSWFIFFTFQVFWVKIHFKLNWKFRIKI